MPGWGWYTQKGGKVRIDRERLHGFVEQRCDEVERKGDWAKGTPLTALQEEKLRELKGDTLALSLAEGIAYGIGNFLIFHANEFLTLPRQLGFDK
jgi:hypothetical protein